MVDEKLAKDGIDIVPFQQSQGFSKFGYFAFEIRPKVNMVSTRIGDAGEGSPYTYFPNIEKALRPEELKLAEEGNGRLIIEVKNLGNGCRTDEERYLPTKMGTTWREFVKIHLTKSVTASYGDEINLFTVTSVEEEIHWTLIFDNPEETLKQSCIGAYRWGDKVTDILEDNIRRFHELLKQAPDDGAVHYGLAVAHAIKSQPEDALDALNKSFQLDKKYAQKILCSQP